MFICYFLNFLLQTWKKNVFGATFKQFIVLIDFKVNVSPLF